MLTINKATVAALMIASSSCSFLDSTRVPRAVVVIVIDTLRADHMGIYGYPRPTSPNIDRFSTEGIVFENFYSSSTWTLPSFGSLFTGELPSRHGAGIIRTIDPENGKYSFVEHADRRFSRLDEKLPTLATSLGRNGFATFAVVNNAFLNPEFGLSRGFAVYDFDENSPERSAKKVVDIALEWLSEPSAATRPIFMFVHFMDVHMPYVSDSSVSGMFTDGYKETLGSNRKRLQAVRGRIARGDEVLRGLYTASYDEGIAYVDQQVGRLFESMKNIGLWDDTLIIVTADHGEALFEHGRWEHGASVLEEVVRVPLIVRGPGIKPGRSEIPASLVDLVPTILEAVEIDSSSDFFGNSLWTSITMGRVLEERDIIVEGTLYGAEQRAIIRWPYKAIHQVAGDKKLLFDLEADPHERVDLSTSYPAQRDQMMESLRDALLVAVDERSVSSGVELDPALMKSLRALGYIR